MSSNSCKRISVWSGPRNVSTALMYAFAQRVDTQAIDEPLYGYYLKVSGADHPGALEVMADMNCNADEVINKVILGSCEKPILFLKNMAHHITNLPLTRFQGITHVLLVRDPVDMLPSLAKGLKQPTLRDTGFENQVMLLENLTAQGQPPPVLEARELLRDPASVLSQLCQQVKIPFDPAMLQWPTGPKPEDGIWAKFWYHSVHRSTGFQPYQPKLDPFPDHLKPLLDICQPYYEKLRHHAITTDDPIP